MPPKAALLLVESIVRQAALEKIPLSEVERKMLLFSETSPTFADIAEINSTFDREYDRAEHEEKVTRLVRNLLAAIRSDRQEKRRWKDMLKSLRRHDYYVLAILNEAAPMERPPGDFVRLVLTALVAVAIVVGVALLFSR